MPFISDPHREWETKWEIEHPEPYPSGPWSLDEVFERSHWQDRKFADYRAWCRMNGLLYGNQ